MSYLKRRTALQMLLATASIGILSACGPAVPAAPTSAPAAAPKPTTAPAAPAAAVATAVSVAATPKPAAAAPKTGGQLRWGQLGDIVNLDPAFQQPSSESTWLVWDRLIANDLQLKPQPMLAESWELSSDATQIKLNLRRGVTFHTGREFTSDDVKYSVQRTADPKVAVGQFAAQARWFDPIETPDKYTVILKSDQPRPLVFDVLEYLNIVDKVTLEGPDAKTKPVGTGPFMFGEWVQGDHATYTKNKNYWQTGKPYLDEIRVVALGDPQAMMVQLETGALDLVRNPVRQEFARMRDNPKFQAIAHPANIAAHVIGIATYSPPLDNKIVRQGLNFALDRQRIVDTVLKGVGKPQSLPWSADSPAYEAEKLQHFAFNLDKAKALFEQAGVPNLSLEIIPNPGAPESTDISLLFQADLAKIGVTLNIIKLEMAVWSDQVNGRKYKGMYYGTAARMHQTPASAFTGRVGNPDDNNQGFRTDEYAELIKSVTTETDQAKLKQMYSKLNDMLLDESFVMYLTPSPLTLLARTGVNGIMPHGHAGWDYTDTWLEN